MDDIASASILTLLAGTVFVASLGSLTLASNDVAPHEPAFLEGSPVGGQVVMEVFVKGTGTTWATIGSTTSSGSNTTSTSSSSTSNTSNPSSVPGVVEDKCHKSKDDHSWKPLCGAAQNTTATSGNATNNATTDAANNITLPPALLLLLNVGNTTGGTWNETDPGFRPGLSSSRGVLDSTKLANLEPGTQGGLADDGKVSYAEVLARFGFTSGQGFRLLVHRLDGRLLVDFGEALPQNAAVSAEGAQFCLDTCAGARADRMVRATVLAWG